MFFMLWPNYLEWHDVFDLFELYIVHMPPYSSEYNLSAYFIKRLNFDNRLELTDRLICLLRIKKNQTNNHIFSLLTDLWVIMTTSQKLRVQYCMTNLLRKATEGKKRKRVTLITNFLLRIGTKDDILIMLLYLQINLYEGDDISCQMCLFSKLASLANGKIYEKIIAKLFELLDVYIFSQTRRMTNPYDDVVTVLTSILDHWVHLNEIDKQRLCESINGLLKENNFHRYGVAYLLMNQHDQFIQNINCERLFERQISFLDESLNEKHSGYSDGKRKNTRFILNSLVRANIKTPACIINKCMKLANESSQSECCYSNFKFFVNNVSIPKKYGRQVISAEKQSTSIQTSQGHHV